MKLIKKSIFFVNILMCITLNSWGDDDSKKAITNLVTEIQTIVKAGGKEEEYKPILLEYFDFNEISKNVLAGVFKEIKNAENKEEALNKINDFLPKFTPVFTDYMIKKYSKPEIIEKFKKMVLKMGTVSEGGKYVSVNTTFKSDSGDSLGDIKVEWKMLNGKVIDMVFSDAAASIFRNEASEATAKYKDAGSLDGLLKAYE